MRENGIRPSGRDYAPIGLGRVSVRVAHVMAGAPQGGAELFFERLCAAQRKAGREVGAFIRHDAPRETRLRQSDVPVKAFTFGGRLDFWTTPRLRRELKSFRPDMAVAWMSRAARLMPPGSWAIAGRLGGYYDLENYRKCSALIGNTLGLTRWMIAQGWPETHVHYLPNFANDMAAVQAERPDFLSVDQPYIIALGRLHKNKGFDVLIRALRRLPGVALLIAGEGPERAALTQLARAEGVSDRVFMPGWVHDPSGWLKAARVLVCSSRIEPLGNVVIEAFSAGIPVVASAIQGPEELLDGTRDGLLAPVEDDFILAAKIGDILESSALAHELGDNARKRFEAEFSEKIVLAKWDRFFARQAS